MDNKKKLIAEKFGIKESNIDFIPGQKEIRTVDTYSFYYTKAINLNAIISLVKVLPNIVLNQSIILESKVILRFN